MTRDALLFSGLSLAPVPLIAAAAWAGGLWALAAILTVSVVAFAADELVAPAHGAGRPAQDFPNAHRLNIVLAVAHFALLGAVIPALAGASDIGATAWAATFAATGLYLGQVSNANAHELIHARRRAPFLLGRWVYISMLFGHHTSAHLLVHHRHTASAGDPNSAKLGRGYYRFVVDAWGGSFRAALAAETARHGHTLANPFALYAMGGVLALWGAAVLGGAAGVAVFVALALWAQAQLLLSDYVQHYGLRRQPGPDGRLEPVGPRHSWNAPHWCTGYMMLNAARHSDHHANPAKGFATLEIAPATQVPTLPYSLPFMGLVALWPPLWRQMMDPRAAAWAAPRPEVLRTAAE